MPPTTTANPARVREVTHFLRSLGHADMAAVLETEYNLGPTTPPLARSTKKPRRSHQRKSRESSKTLVSLTSSLVASVEVLPVPFPVVTESRLVVTCTGDSDDLWSSTPAPELDGGIMAPAFEHGAGILRGEFIDNVALPVSFVPVQPYAKQPPPSGLPYKHFTLQVFYEEGKTGSEAEVDLALSTNTVIADRYVVEAPLDAATFSRTAKALDTQTGDLVCLKVIRNSKSFFDQALDEVRVLTCVNAAGDADACCVLRLLDYFYCREHFILVTELLSVNLYEHARGLDAAQRRAYFTLHHLQCIARQVLTALQLIHSIHLIHCDIKPENIAFKSVPRCEVKVLDLGSSCYVTDSLSSYVQSRSYRAPEVILGCQYGTGVDVWSLGATLAELATGTVLFNPQSLPALLASMCSVCGRIPAELLQEGRNTAFYVTQHGALYEYVEDNLFFHFPKEAPPAVELFGYDDAEYVSFVRQCLILDPALRPSAAFLLEHPFITKKYDDEA